DVRPFIAWGIRGQDGEREADPLRHLPAEPDRLDSEPSGERHGPGCVELGGLEAAGAKEFELGTFGQKGVDLAVDELVALPVLTLLGDYPPAQDADLLDGVSIRDRLDGV